MVHNYSIDLLRGIAAFGIVGCHLMLYPKTGGSLALTEFCDTFVGLFAALSGFFMGAKIVYGENAFATFLAYVQRRASRILPTFFAWTGIYIIVGLLFDVVIQHELGAKWHSSGFWFDVLFLGSASCHLWFLICLFYGQIVLGGVLAMRQKMSWSFSLILGFLLIGVAAFFPEGCWWTFYPLRLLGFLVTGYGIARIPKITSVHGLYGCLLALIVGMTAHYVLGIYLPRFIRDWFVVVPLLILFVKISLPMRLHNFAESLGRTSMGVFLIHPIFAAGLGLVFKRVYASPYGILPWLLDWICCWGCSLLVTVVLMRVPYMRRIVV